MIKVGLTGCIASGKSTVSKMLASLGAKIVDADQVAKDIVLPGKAGLRAIVDTFGKEFLLTDGNLNRAFLGDKIFRDFAARNQLNNILHPLIKEAVHNQITKWENMKSNIVVLDVPLLFETGWQNQTDVNWVVYVDDATQLIRLMARNNYSEEEAKMRIASQMPLAEKIKLADVVIDNSGDLLHTKVQVERAWSLLGSFE